ncbi:MAG TPA: DNA ligase D [Vicinamibacterales bacterium]|nr:DNA ligase D [Vicinamibacterales bacterium]
MLASLTDAPLQDPQFVYEPKYDGIRAIAEVSRDQVRLWSRLGNEKTDQFPEIAAALTAWARTRRDAVVLDGEIVALDGHGEPTGFQQLQGRIHLTEGGGGGVAYVVFDVLRIGRDDLRDRPLTERRQALERLFAKGQTSMLRISAQVAGDARAMYKEALAHGWEGLIAKQAASLYKSGKRTPDWRKLKIVREQEFVVGGWTEPRHTRSYFGALLLGVYDGDRLVYAGHTGTGFNEKELARVSKLLKPLETAACPFTPKPKTNERPHWAKPELVAQIKFTEWTADGKLRHPVYLGLRDDKRPADVTREDRPRVPGSGFGTADSDLIEQLNAIERSRHDGVLTLPDGATLKVGNLHKIFWPKQRLTKGDLFRYYVRVAPFLLPAVADRPLVMKRYPNGVDAKPFYQHRVETPPAGIRTEVVSVVEQRPQIIGGSLLALLYTTQLAAISQDPWCSRVQHPQFADYVALDLDPADDVPFAKVLDVARWIRDELDALGAVGVPKTSGASGLHVYIPLPKQTPYDAGLLFCQIIATVVAHKHPKAATVERSVRARGRRTYIDFMQNVLGKTLATAYSARASAYAGVSAPVSWTEIDEGIDREDFTITTMPARLEQVGDLWAALRSSKGVDLGRVARYTEAPHRAQHATRRGGG